MIRIPRMDSSRLLHRAAESAIAKIAFGCNFLECEFDDVIAWLCKVGGWFFRDGNSVGFDGWWSIFTCS